jgi:GT2 family glycosyltransferase
VINSTTLKNEKIEVSVIIVSYNTADWIRICLNSIAADHDCSKEVFVIDNASIDDSVALLKKNYPWVHLLANKENRGFAAANNQVLSRCQGKFIFFLNPDTKVEHGSLRTLISFMEANPFVGLAGSRLVFPDGKFQESVSYRYPGQSYTTSELTGLKGSIAWVLGASMIARTEILRKAGGFDEDFFLYGEEQDLCLRIRKTGYEIGYCPEAGVVHLGGYSERTSSSLELWTKKTRAEYHFYKKHYLRPNMERLLRREFVKACWRIATLNLSLPFVKNKERVKEKLVKYRVIYRESRCFAHENDLPKNP